MTRSSFLEPPRMRIGTLTTGQRSINVFPRKLFSVNFCISKFPSWTSVQAALELCVSPWNLASSHPSLGQIASEPKACQEVSAHIKINEYLVSCHLSSSPYGPGCQLCIPYYTVCMYSILYCFALIWFERRPCLLCWGTYSQYHRDCVCFSAGSALDHGHLHHRRSCNLKSHTLS